MIISPYMARLASRQAFLTNLTKLNKTVFKREHTQTCLEFAERKQLRPKVKYSYAFLFLQRSQ